MWGVFFFKTLDNKVNFKNVVLSLRSKVLSQMWNQFCNVELLKKTIQSKVTFILFEYHDITMYVSLMFKVCRVSSVAEFSQLRLSSINNCWLCSTRTFRAAKNSKKLFMIKILFKQKDNFFILYESLIFYLTNCLFITNSFY